MEKPQNQKSNKRTGMIEFMARNSVASNLLMLLLLVGGVYTMYNIQKEVFPQFQLDFVNVSVTYPGSSPEEVEQGILMPVEESVRGIQGIKEIVSTAREGSGEVSIELIAGTDRMKAFQDIDQAVTRIRTFPDDIEEPEVVLQDRQRDVMEISLYGNADIWTLRKVGDRLRNRLLSQPMITQVALGNVPDYETRVEISSNTLRKYGLTLGQVANLIQETSQDVPAGAVETQSGEILLRMKERKQWADEFGNITIATSASGAQVKLADIAEITDDFVESGFHGQFNQQTAIGMEIFRVGDQSPLDIEDVVNEVMTNFQLPPGINYRIDSNRADDSRERLSLLTENGVLAIFIVMFILSLFLEYRLAFWVMMGMVISFVGGVIILPLIGVSINMISMFGFLVVLGIVVDDAIVVGENVFEFRQQGMGKLEAAIAGAKDMSKPVTFSILTNIIAFVPLLLIPGTTGKYWWPLPAVVIIVLALSLFEALFILPAHLAHIREKKSTGFKGRLESFQQAFAEKFKNFINTKYRTFLELCIHNRYITLSSAIALLLIVGGFGYSDHMGLVLMPEQPADEIEAGASLPVGTTNDQASRVAEEITAASYLMFEENDLFEQAEGIKTNVRGQEFIDVEIVMKPPAERSMTTRELMELWRDSIGDIEGIDQITFEVEAGPAGYLPDISVDLSHSDINILEEASQAFLQRMEGYENTADISDNYNRGKQQFDFKLLPEARKLGLTSEEVGEQVRAGFFGALAMRQLRGTNEIEVRVKLPKEERKDLYNLEEYLIRTENGVEVPLYDIAEVETGEAFTSINRRDGRRVVGVSMDVEPA